jgi:hypothetical protein
MKKLVLLFAMITLAFSSIVPSVVLNQNSPKYGDSVNFTVIFPKKIKNVKVNNPIVDMKCYQEEELVYQSEVTTISKMKIGKRMYSSQSGYVLLENGSNEPYWNEKDAVCTATLYSFSKNGNIIVIAEQNNIEVKAREEFFENNACDNLSWIQIIIDGYPIPFPCK